MHVLGADKPLSKSFPVDEPFANDFVLNEISAYHIEGHTPGFTIYIYHDVLFICDYAFPPNPKMQLNPYGPKLEALQGAKYIHGIISKQSLKTVCAYNYSL